MGGNLSSAMGCFPHARNFINPKNDSGDSAKEVEVKNPAEKALSARIEIQNPCCSRPEGATQWCRRLQPKSINGLDSGQNGIRFRPHNRLAHGMRLACAILQ